MVERRTGGRTTTSGQPSPNTTAGSPGRRPRSGLRALPRRVAVPEPDVLDADDGCLVCDEPDRPGDPLLPVGLAGQGRLGCIVTVFLRGVQLEWMPPSRP